MSSHLTGRFLPYLCLAPLSFLCAGECFKSSGLPGGGCKRTLCARSASSALPLLCIALRSSPSNWARTLAQLAASWPGGGAENLPFASLLLRGVLRGHGGCAAAGGSRTAHGRRGCARRFANAWRDNARVPLTAGRRSACTSRLCFAYFRKLVIAPSVALRMRFLLEANLEHGCLQP